MAAVTYGTVKSFTLSIIAKGQSLGSNEVTSRVCINLDMLEFSQGSIKISL